MSIVERVLHNFGWSPIIPGGMIGDGTSPVGSVVHGTDGALYGTTYADTRLESSPMGTIFRLNTDGSAYAILRNFEYTGGDGVHPRSLVETSDGGLFGTTALGGSSGFPGGG